MKVTEAMNNENRIYYYKEKADGSVILLRSFGESPVVRVPSLIEGKAVSEIGSYCFAANAHLPAAYSKSMTGMEKGDEALLTEQAGRFLRSIELPDSITKIAAYAFYGCRLLSEISFGKGIASLDNDAFMNCTGLARLYLRAGVEEVSALRSFLAQITWNIEVFFAGEEEGAFFFPEYYEQYEELGPVHIFELQLEGEGFRARKAFANEVFRPQEYDSVFPKASVEEKPQIASAMAIDRFLYPVALTEENRSMYETFLRSNQQTAAKLLCFSGEKSVGKVTEERLLSLITVFFDRKVFEKDTLEYLIEEFSRQEKAEITAGLIGLRRRYFAPQKKSRYSFDDF